jgi:hypothetical protein
MSSIAAGPRFPAQEAESMTSCRFRADQCCRDIELERIAIRMLATISRPM